MWIHSQWHLYTPSPYAISIHFHLRAIGSPFWLPSCSYKFCCAFPFHLSDTVMIPPSYSNVSWVIWHFWSKTMSLHTTVTIQPRGTSTMNMLGFILLEHWLVFCVLAAFSRHSVDKTKCNIKQFESNRGVKKMVEVWVQPCDLIKSRKPPAFSLLCCYCVVLLTEHLWQACILVSLYSLNKWQSLKTSLCS